MVVSFPTPQAQDKTGEAEYDVSQYDHIPGADQVGEGVQHLLELCRKIGIDPKKIKLSKAGEKSSLVGQLSSQQRRQLIKNNNQ